MTIVKKYKIFHSFLTKKQQSKFYLIILFLIFQSILEVVGIGLVIPLISIIIDSEKFFFFDFIGLNISSISLHKTQLIFLTLTVIFVFFIFKSYFLYKSSKVIYNFAYEVQIGLKDKIFKNYISMEYEDYLKTKSSRLISNISTNVPLITQYFSIPILSLVAEGLILVAILLFLLFFETKGFIILSLCLLLTLLITYKTVSFKLKTIGSKKEELENKLVKIIQNGIGSIKVTKLYDLEKTYNSEFSKLNGPLGKIQATTYVFQNIPRFALELIGFVAISLLVFVLIYTGVDNARIITIVGLFAAAGFKIIPSVNRMIFSLQGIKFSSSVLETIKNILERLSLQNKQKDQSLLKENIKIKFNNSINFKNISYKYPNTNEYILKDFNFQINKNKKIGIIGASGSGKTTFLDILTGLLNPEIGEISIDEKNVNLNSKNWRKKIAYVPQFNYLIDDTLIRNIAFGIDDEKIDFKLIEELLTLTMLKSEIVNKNSNGIKMIVGERGLNLSGGQIQRIGIARALYKKPDVLIMDEPTSSLDTINEQSIIDNICQIKDLTIIIVSHRKSSLIKCDELYKFEGGKIFKQT